MRIEKAVEGLGKYYERTGVPPDRSERYIHQVNDLLLRMPSLGGREVEELTDFEWHEACQQFRHTDKVHSRWSDLLAWKTYVRLRNSIVFARDRYTCQICGLTLERLPSGVSFVADHIVPRSAKGEDDLSNLRCSCSICNMAKGAHNESTFRLVWH